MYHTGKISKNKKQITNKFQKQKIQIIPKTKNQIIPKTKNQIIQIINNQKSEPNLVMNKVIKLDFVMRLLVTKVIKFIFEYKNWLRVK